MSFYENIFDFITDKSKHLSTRATVLILSVVCLIFIDNIIGFSYYYNKERQLNQLKSISILLNDSTLSQDTKNELIELEKLTFKRKSIIDYSITFINGISWTTTTKSNINEPQTERNEIWFFISASGFYILVTIFVVPILLFTDKKTPFSKLLASIIIFIVVMFFTCWFNYWLFDKIIPDKVFGSWIWNYTINFILQIGLIVGLLFATNTINKKNTSR